MSEVPPHKFTELVKAYVAADLAIFPLRDLKSKTPAVPWGDYNKTGTRASVDDAVRWWCGGRFPGVAMITGTLSGNLQCLDFDSDEDDGESHAAWCKEVERQLPGLVDTLVHETSQSGGHHYIYRCSAIAGGVTLASTEPRLQANGKKRPTALIETKEQGRYFVCFPTPGYNTVRGHLLNIPTILPEQRAVLYSVARSLNKNVSSANPGYRFESNPNMPGSLYTAQATMDDIEALVLEGGWTRIRQEEGDEVRWFWRPDKHEGSQSANIKVINGTPLFYVYSSSAAPFVEHKGVNAFTVRTFIKHDGDFKACAAELRTMGFGSDEEEEKTAKPDAKAIAKEMTMLIKHEWAFDIAADCWRQWSGQLWKKDPGIPPAPLVEMMGDCINDFGRARVNSAGQILGNLTLVKMSLQREFDRQSDRINFNNGTLWFTEGQAPELKPHTEADNLTNSVGYDYTPDEDFPNIRQFLRDTIPDEAARFAYAAHLGLALRSDITMHKALVLIGGKNSGKSTAFRLANMVCGNPAISGPGGQIFSEEQEGLRARASWHEKLLVAIDEMPADALRYENVTKAMLAHSSVPMRHLNQRELESNAWRPKVLFTCNEEPRFTDRTATVKRRLLYILCPNAREDDDPTINRRLSGQLREEIGSFVKFCLDQAEQVLLESGYPESTAMKQFADRVEIESDALKAFMHYHVVFDPDAFTPSSLVWDDYASFCHLTGHKGVLSQTAMVRAIGQRYGRAKGVSTTQKRVAGARNAVRGLQGLRMRGEHDADSEDLYTL